MAARCETCLKTLQRTLGPQAMRGTAQFKPDAVFDADFATDVIGRPVRVLHFGHSSGPGDVAVFDPQSGVLFAGGLLDAQRIPDAQDGEIEGWLRALQALRAQPAALIVPGHGPATDASAIEAQERYLRQLDARVRELLRAGTALSAVPDASGLPEFAAWDQYETQHRRNASMLFVRVQREQLQQQK